MNIITSVASKQRKFSDELRQAIERSARLKLDGRNPRNPFFEGPNRSVDVFGRLDVLGGGGVQAIFTHVFDDIAGDTNNDGNGTAPAPGQWVGLVFNGDSDASQVNGARVRYEPGESD